MFSEHHAQLNLGFRSENVVFTGDGFGPKSGFRNLLCSQDMDSVLYQVSQTCCVHQRTLKKIVYFCCTTDISTYRLIQASGRFSENIDLFCQVYTCN